MIGTSAAERRIDPDDDSFDQDDFFGSFTEHEVDSRGRLETTIDHDHVLSASKRILKSGVLNLLDDWEQIDNPIPGQGGRPAIINRHAILVGLLLLAAEKNSLWIRNLNRLFYRRLTPESREYLGLPTPVASFGIASREETRWEKNVGNSLHRLLKLMDPYPMKRYVNLAYSQIRDVLEAHDTNREKIARARLNLFTNALLLMTFHEQPRRLRRISKNLDISFDQTTIHSPTLSKWYTPKTLEAKIAAEVAAVESGDIDEIRRLSRTSTVDPFAGYHAKTETNRSDHKPGTKDTTSPTASSAKDTEYTWGWEVNIAVRVDSESPKNAQFPQLAVAATLSMPNIGVSEEAVELMRLALATGLKPGLADADKQYWANATVARLHRPAHDLGWTPSTDYKIDRLGPHGKKTNWEQNPESSSSRDHGTAPELPPLFKWRPSTTRRNKTGSTTLSTKSGSKRGEHFKSMRRSGPTRRAVSPSAAPHEATARRSLALSSNSLWSATGRRCPQSPIRSVPESRTTTPPTSIFSP